MTYVAEPVPLDVERVLAEYLQRQTTAIQLAVMNASKAMEVSELPVVAKAGEMVCLNDRADAAKNGIYAGIYNDQGAVTWQKLATTP
jgi:hypothetical protein